MLLNTLLIRTLNKFLNGPKNTPTITIIAQEKMINISKLLVNQCQDQLKKNPIKITLKLSKILLEKQSFINKYNFILKQYRDIFCYIIIKKCQLAMFQHPPRDLLAESSGLTIKQVMDLLL